MEKMMRSKLYVLITTLLALTFLSSSVGAKSVIAPEVKCHARKLNASGKYDRCRLRARAKALRTSTAADFSVCEIRFSLKFSGAEILAGAGVCPSEMDEADINARVSAQASDISTLLAGGALAVCGDTHVDKNEQCDGSDLVGATCTLLGFSGGVLACDASCFYDLSACTADGGGLVPGVDQILPATGQTTAAGAQSDGAIRAGVALSYTDNGDGTITDNNTGLMWEKKDDSGGVHDKDNTYTWSSGTDNLLDGTLLTSFLNTLDDVAGGGASCFAGHCDWRVPNRKELDSIVDLGRTDPPADPVFHRADTCLGCTDITLPSCSCTARSLNWSSSTIKAFPDLAWGVNFGLGTVNGASKSGSIHAVRAVRGGGL